MKKIASFTVNHDTLQKGMYISRIDGDVVTYDIRMKRPNMGDYLTNGALHTFEHLFAHISGTLLSRCAFKQTCATRSAFARPHRTCSFVHGFGLPFSTHVRVRAILADRWHFRKRHS